MNRLLLLNPGPVTLTAHVRNALNKPDLCHREPEFAELSNDVLRRLSRVYPESAQTHVPVLLTSSGTGAVEAMLGSLVPREGKALVLANGVYGERMNAMLAAQGKASILIRSEWTQIIDIKKTEAALAQDPSITHVLAIHHETTTGRLNDINAVGKLCKLYDKKLLLDAVSSFGAEEIRFAEWNLQACAATANKCLHGVPGIAFVVCDKSTLDNGVTASPSVYLDLFRYRKEQLKGYSPFTQSVQVLYALQAALQEFEDSGGWLKRRDLYTQRSRKVMLGLRELGVQLFLESFEASSSVLVSYRTPDSTSYSKIHDVLKDNGFIVYAGQGQFEGKIFRISTMGDLSDADLDRLLLVLQKTLF